MNTEPLVVNGKTFPATLEILKKEEGNMDNNWHIKPVYFLELKHGLMGFFPAVFTNQKRMIITLDRDMLSEIWKTLSPRSSKMEESLFYVNKAEPVGYPAQHYMGDKSSNPNQLLTREEFEKLRIENEPFEWAPGLIGNDMSSKEFIRTIESAMEKVH